ncbi:hypothetical protein QBC46DRAFT_454238 [Diplogelasinospora grovesii]|uniref:Uncharacterized protein n=1 Tax=Diplogelasinospora grovesii TaxID=303347 RepID=A0AAN6RZM9_9PEZI|nr:hypothetical protein QBC46DRAFT_454238 [Diplogelasinospora grovesii]
MASSLSMAPINRLRDDHSLLGDLDMSFRRTIRVPDNHQVSKLPPDLGKFPLFQVARHVSGMPADMVAKGGLSMPMYQREAMWIPFKLEKRYAIRDLRGAVNAVSGEPAVETAATTLRRRQRMARGQPIQDYIVVPDQKWLDRVATPWPFQLGHAALQHAELLSRQRPLGRGFAAFRRDALHLLIREVADDFWRENEGEFLKQTPLNGKVTDIVNKCLQCDLSLSYAKCGTRLGRRAEVAFKEHSATAPPATRPNL